MLPSVMIFRVMMRGPWLEIAAICRKFTENRGKIRAKFVVNRGDIGRKFPVSHRKLGRASAENRGKVRFMVLEQTFPFSFCEMIIFSIHLSKRPGASSFKTFDG
jgi:hypothetical protein